MRWERVMAGDCHASPPCIMRCSTLAQNCARPLHLHAWCCQWRLRLQSKPACLAESFKLSLHACVGRDGRAVSRPLHRCRATCECCNMLSSAGVFCYRVTWVLAT